MNLPIYKIVAQDALSGMFKISLVDEPANEVDFVKLGKNTTHDFCKLSYSEEKREIVGALLVPDKKIFRMSEQLGMHHIVFTKEEITKLSMSMFENFKSNNPFNAHHSVDLGDGDVQIISLWQKESNVDLSTEYGFGELPNGTLFLKAFVKSDEVWKRIKKGEFKGFSPELEIGKLKLKKEKMNQDGKFHYLELAVGQPIFEKTQDQTYLTAETAIVVDNVSLKIENGLIAEIVEEKEPKTDNEELSLENLSTGILTGVQEMLNSVLDPLTAEIDELKAELQAEKEKTKAIETLEARDITVIAQYDKFCKENSVDKLSK